MRYFKVLRDGELWTDWLKSEDLAYDHINECINRREGSAEDFEVLPMTEEEIKESIYE